jgi:hypothetical protein
MGLLEDAIREHLDLKRQHGADPTEVAAEEREALGPVQRTVEPAVVDDEDASEDASTAHDEPAEDGSAQSRRGRGRRRGRVRRTASAASAP